MGYTKMLYLDEVEEMINKIESVLLEDSECDPKYKAHLQEFVYEMDEYIRKKTKKAFVRDLRQMNEKQFYWKDKKQVSLNS